MLCVLFVLAPAVAGCTQTKPSSGLTFYEFFDPT